MLPCNSLPKQGRSNLLRKEARLIEIFESDHDRGRNGQRFGTRGLCANEGSAATSDSQKIITAAGCLFVGGFAQEARSCFDLAFSPRAFCLSEDRSLL